MPYILRPVDGSRGSGIFTSSRMICRAIVSVGLAASSLVPIASRYHDVVRAQPEERPRLSVKPTEDFEVTGAGAHAAWREPEWTPLRRRQPEGHPYESRFKVLYSSTGMYF